jgi:hypothetical protein
LLHDALEEPFDQRSKAHNRQLNIDHAECEAYAAGNAPMPAIPQGAANYDLTGTSMSRGGQSSSFSGTATPSRGFASGVAQGSATGAMFATASLRKRLLTACMYRLGWDDGAK